MRTLDLPGIKKVKSGKVREVFDLGEALLFVATDRISAFDYILPQTIPGKGSILNSISVFWFDYLNDIIPNHIIECDINKYPVSLKPFASSLKNRSMIVKKTEVVKLECIVRGYITGSGWGEYVQTGKVCGITLPKGLQKSQKLEEPIFTPSTKADVGHDENIDEKKAIEIVGQQIFDAVKKASIDLYCKARDYAFTKGIIIADTKFEFGMAEGKLYLIDEVLTPDSSRFWPADKHVVGQEPPSFDKQLVRNYLLNCGWDKNPPVPDLPEDVIQNTAAKYAEVYELLTGKKIQT